jgi:hypothetical protein
MKTLTTISLDVEVALEAKAHIPNLSRTINNYLKEYLEVKRNTEGSDEQTLKNELIKLKAQAADMEAELKQRQKIDEKKKGVVIIDD